MGLAKNSITLHEGRIKLKDNNSVNHSFIATKKKKRKERKHGQVQNNRVGKDEQLLKKCTAALGKKYLKGMTLEVFVQNKKFYVFNIILQQYSYDTHTTHFHRTASHNNCQYYIHSSEKTCQQRFDFLSSF